MRGRQRMRRRQRMRGQPPMHGRPRIAWPVGGVKLRSLALFVLELVLYTRILWCCHSRPFLL